MRLPLILLFCFSFIILKAQPGPFGGYDMSFKLIDPKTKSFVTNNSKKFKVYSTFYFKDLHEETEPFKYNPQTKAFSYSFNSTPVGASIPDQFSIYVISGKDTMKVYFAQHIMGDTLQFQKGEFIATSQYYFTKRISTYNSTQLLNSRIYDYETTKLTRLPYFEIKEQAELKLHGLTYSVFQAKTLPNNDVVAYGITNERVDKPDPPIKDLKNNDGLVEILKSDPTALKIDYNFEILDSLLASVNQDFRLKDAGFRELFPTGLNWQETNSQTFAIINNLQVLNDTNWFITLNQHKDNKQIFVSHDQGKSWKRILSVKTEFILNLQLTNQQDLVAFAGTEVFLSPDIGKTWSNNILQNNTQRIYDLVLGNETTGFMMVKTEYSSELLKFNLKTGKTTKLLGNLGCCYVEPKLNQKATNLLFFDSMVVINHRDGFIVSKDLGKTWQVITNDCTKLLKNGNLYTWYKGKAQTENNTTSYGHYYPRYSRCGTVYYFKSALISPDKKLNVLGYYNKDGVGSPHIFGEVSFIGL